MAFFFSQNKKISLFLFQVANKQGKAFTFFLSSEYERSQWVETLQVLQSSLPSNHTTSAQAKNMSMYELQKWITSCRQLLKTNMGSFLMRSVRDEPLLVGDLHFKIHSLQGTDYMHNLWYRIVYINQHYLGELPMNMTFSSILSKITILKQNVRMFCGLYAQDLKRTQV